MAWLIGVALNLIGSILINLGTNLIRLGHIGNAKAEASATKPSSFWKSPRSWTRYPGNKVWFSGLVGFGIGNALNFLSFAYASVGILSALSSIQFVSNIGFAWFVNKERPTLKVVLATLVLAVGCVLLVMFGNHESPILTSQQLKELYSGIGYISYVVLASTTALVSYAAYRYGKKVLKNLAHDAEKLQASKWNRWVPILFALSSGIVGTQSVLYGKSLSLIMRSTVAGNAEVKNWYAWLTLILFLGFAIFWMKRFNKAMKLFPVSIMMPILQIVWVFFSMMAGSLYFQEFEAMNHLQISMFVTGTIVLLGGLYLLTSAQASKVRNSNNDNSSMQVEPDLESGTSRADDAITKKGFSIKTINDDINDDGNKKDTTAVGQPVQRRYTISVTAAVSGQKTTAPVRRNQTLTVVEIPAIAVPRTYTNPSLLVIPPL